LGRGEASDSPPDGGAIESLAAPALSRDGTSSKECALSARAKKCGAERCTASTRIDAEFGVRE
jgi:hypothetical protein